MGTRSINTDRDIEYLSMLASTGQPSFRHPLKNINSKIISTKDVNTQSDPKLNYSEFEHTIRSSSHYADDIKKKLEDTTTNLKTNEKD